MPGRLLYARALATSTKRLACRRLARLVAQRYCNMSAAIAVALKKTLAGIEKRHLALCVNAPDG